VESRPSSRQIPQIGANQSLIETGADTKIHHRLETSVHSARSLNPNLVASRMIRHTQERILRKSSIADLSRQRYPGNEKVIAHSPSFHRDDLAKPREFLRAIENAAAPSPISRKADVPQHVYERFSSFAQGRRYARHRLHAAALVKLQVPASSMS